MRMGGRRVTSQRRLILDLIRGAEGHLDADGIYRRAKEIDPRISLSTVYRSIKLFKELGLIEERHFAEEHHHYEIKNRAVHCHLICQGCGQINELESPLIEQVKEEIESKSGFRIADVEIYLKGYCQKCQRKEVEG